jgi:hypothetical protein
MSGPFAARHLVRNGRYPNNRIGEYSCRRFGLGGVPVDFIDKIREIASRIPKQLDYCLTEEATKNAMVLPFINALGYDIFNPLEVVPEFVADIGIKKGEKVDYAILRDGKPIILFECKWASANLNEVHASQLFRYFSAVLDVRFGIVTNGVVYRFHTDLDAANRMDEKPFFEFNMLDFQDRDVNELKKFSKSAFNLDEILTTASDLKYTAAIRRVIAQEFEQPSDNFVRFLAAQVYPGKITQNVKAQFADITQRALKRFLNDSINERLKTALESDLSISTPMIDVVAPAPGDGTEEDKRVEIVTSEEEIEGYFVVKSVLRDVVNVKRIHIRDAKSYCSVLLDNNNRKPICRLYFNRAQKYIGLFNDSRQEERVPIDEVDDIYKYANRLITTVKVYGPQQGAETPPQPKPPTSESKGEELNYTGKKLQGIIFRGMRYGMATWKDAWLAVLDLMRNEDQRLFEKVAVTLVGRKAPYITPNKAELRDAMPIPKTTLYAETNIGAQTIVKLCYTLVEKMGGSRSELVFQTDESAGSRMSGIDKKPLL